MKSLKLKDCPGENISYCCAEILVDDKRLKNSGAFNIEHLRYITHIFEKISGHIFNIWSNQKNKEVTDFIKKLSVCDEDRMRPEYLITYAYLVHEAVY